MVKSKNTFKKINMEKWLSDTEMPDGVCMLSMTRKILEEGRKEGFDIGYLKGLMAAQSKE